MRIKRDTAATEGIDTVFGIGCLHFGLKEPPDEAAFDSVEVARELLGDQGHLKHIEDALGEMPNIEAVSVRVASHQGLLVPGDLPGIAPLARVGFGIGCYPHIDPLEINFDLYLPPRIQKSFAPWKNEPWPERWRVSFRSAQRLPITFVRPLGVSPAVRPSSGVLIAREYLRSQKEILAKYGVELETLGPSPFHADCALVGVDEDLNTAAGYTCTYEKQRGYGVMTFAYSKHRFSSSETALEAVWTNLKDELGLYYLAVQVRNLRAEGADEVREAVGDLVRAHIGHGIGGIWQRTFSGSRLNPAFLAITEQEDRILTTERLLQDGRRDVYATLQARCLEELVDEAVADAKVSSIAHFSELATLFETRRATNIGLLAVIMSSLIGGAVGATLTALLTG